MTRKLGSFNRRKWRVKRDKGRKHKVRDRAGEKEHSMQDKLKMEMRVWHENMLLDDLSGHTRVMNE